MKRWLLLVLFPLGLLANPDASFHQATSLYNEGDYEGALQAYLEIDQISPALDYNIGTTLMRLDRPSEAIARFRRAQWFTPGDPDLQANLNRAVEILNIEEQPLPLPRTLTGWWTPSTWQRVLMVSCWITAGIGFVTTALPRFRGLRFWTIPPAFAVLLIAGLGTWASLPMQYRSEAVIAGPQGITRFEPLPDATEQHSLPGGTLVRVLEESRGWKHIVTKDIRGWIPAEDLIQL